MASSGNQTGIIWIKGAAVSRIPDYGAAYVLAPRYTLITIPFVTGSPMVFAALWVGTRPPAQARALTIASFAVAVLLVSVSYAAAGFNQPSIAYQQRNIELLKSGNEVEIEDGFPGCRNGYCTESLAYLEDEEKNILDS